MTEEVKFIRGNDRISQLAQRPDTAAGVAQVRADMAEADRTHAMGPAALDLSKSAVVPPPPRAPLNPL